METDLQTIKNALKPIDRRSLSVLLDELGVWIETFKSSVPERIIDKALSGYAEVLAEMPHDLAHTAVRKVRHDHKYAGIPQPGDLKSAVLSDYEKRRWQKIKLEQAKLCGQEAPPPPKPRTPEDNERLAKLLAEARAALRTPNPDLDLGKGGWLEEPPAVTERQRQREARDSAKASAAFRKFAGLPEQPALDDDQDDEMREAV